MSDIECQPKLNIIVKLFIWVLNAAGEDKIRLERRDSGGET